MGFRLWISLLLGLPFLCFSALFGYMYYQSARNGEVDYHVSGCYAQEIAMTRSDFYVTVRCNGDFLTTTRDHEEIRKFFNYSSVLRLAEVKQMSLMCSVTRGGSVTNCR